SRPGRRASRRSHGPRIPWRRGYPGGNGGSRPLTAPHAGSPAPSSPRWGADASIRGPAMSYFTVESLRFLRGIARHNSKPWFEAHRAEYERHVKEPMAELVQEMDIRMSRFAPEITGDPRRSMSRLNRDIRFSRDKSPYKTHAACWFYHADGSSKVGREAHGGGAGF